MSCALPRGHGIEKAFLPPDSVVVPQPITTGCTVSSLDARVFWYVPLSLCFGIELPFQPISFHDDPTKIKTSICPSFCDEDTLSCLIFAPFASCHLATLPCSMLTVTKSVLLGSITGNASSALSRCSEWNNLSGVLTMMVHRAASGKSLSSCTSRPRRPLNQSGSLES
ncbi:hypothetical protein B0T20DRAFT_118664 [Sordaria brevicollis]|uniref:Uncharacterized protein n=1 Tax=Sordaria brevicollis TaxID=83679 RepID=A0AAE0PKL2_SORBR|nr:hypothetical protein B0T20DRAFT_118664 [Sordaria brevicollis]